MAKIFALDGPLYSALSLVADVVIVTVFTVVLTIPVVTAGPAWSASFAVLFDQLRGNGQPVLKMLRARFTSDFRQTWYLGVIVVILFAGIAYELAVLAHMEDFGLPIEVMKAALVIAGFLLLSLVCWLFPLASQFSFGGGELFTQTAIMATTQLWRTIVAALLWLILPATWMVSTVGGIRMTMVYIVFGVGFTMYLQAIILFSPVQKMRGEGDIPLGGQVGA